MSHPLAGLHRQREARKSKLLRSLLGMFDTSLRNAAESSGIEPGAMGEFVLAEKAKALLDESSKALEE